MKEILIFLLGHFLLVQAKSQEKTAVYFEYNVYTITTEAKLKLDSFLDSNQPTERIIAINLSGHCDSRGTDEYNDQLSFERVRVIQTYLLSRGVPSDRIKSVAAMGKRQPINENSNEPEMALNRRVEITIQKDVPRNIQEEKTAAKTLTEQINDTTTKAGRNLILKNLNFEGGRHILLPGSLPVLDELLKALKNNDSLEIFIEGHVCCAQGSIDGLDVDTRTFNLSVNRAKMIYDYLVKNGIDSTRLSWDGYGNKYPIIATEVTESDRMTNRRVEIRILKR